MDDEATRDLGGRYKVIRAASREAVLANDIIVDPLPHLHEPRWGVSTVFRPSLSERVWDDVLALQKAAGPHHATYDPDSVHVTVRSNECFRSPVAPDDGDVSLYVDAMRASLIGAGSLKMMFKGMIAVRTGIVLCGYPMFDLTSLRQRYYQELQARNAIRPGPEALPGKIRDTCHASLLMFSDALAEPAQTVAMLDTFCDRDYGTVQIEAFDVVTYQRSSEQITTTTLASVPMPDTGEPRMSHSRSERG